MSLPFISVIVPVYNGENIIRPCIESLLAVQYPKESLEIIIVDNNSTDRTSEIIKSLPVTFATETKPGAAAARNAGIALARGEIIAFTDSDCTVDRFWVQEVANTFQNHAVDAVMGFAGGNNANFFAELAQQRWEEFWYKKGPEGYTLRRQGIDTRNCAISKRILDQIGGFDADFLHCEDLELSIRINAAGGLLRFNPNMKVWHRNPTSFAASIEKAGPRMAAVLRMMRDHSTDKGKASLPFASSAFYGIAEQPLPGILLNLSLLILKLLRVVVYTLFGLFLRVHLRHFITFKLYKIFYGLSYEIAILEDRKQCRLG